MSRKRLGLFDWMQGEKKTWQLLLFLLFISLILRLFAFHFSVIDHDESTYLVIADQMLKGDLLYVDVIDNKPPSIFLLFAFIQTLFGKSIVMLRVVASAFLALTAFLLYQARKHYDGRESKATLAALIYLLISSLYRFGMSANTELFLNAFNALALLCLVQLIKNPKRLSYAFAMGLALGISFSFKYVAAADYAAFALIIFGTQASHKSLNIPRLIAQALFSLLGFLLPFAFIIGYYNQIGHLDDLFYYTLEAGSKYSGQNILESPLKTFIDFHLKYLPIVILFYFLLYRETDKVLKYATLLWYACVWGIILYLQKGFNHYFWQLFLPMAWFLPQLIDWGIWNRFWFFKRRKLIALCSFLLLLGIIWGNQSYFYTQVDASRVIAAELKDKVKADDQILVGSYGQLVPYLLDLEPMSKYVHPTMVYEHYALYDLNPEEEVGAMLDQKPEFVIFKEDKFIVTSLNERFEQEYEFYQKVWKLKVYQRKP